MPSLLDFMMPQQQQQMPMGYPQQQQIPYGQVMPQQPAMDTSNLANRIQEMLGARQPNQGGMAQDILTARFNPQQYQPTLQDISGGIMKSAPLGAPLQTGTDMAAGRFSAMMDMVSKINQMQQMQIMLGKMNEDMRHNRVIEGQSPQALPITTQPTPAGGGGPTMGMSPPNPMPSGGNMSPPNANKMAELYPAEIPTGGGASSPQGGNVPLFKSDQTIMPQPQQNASQYTPLYRGNLPYTEGLPQGKQWAQGADGKMVAIQVPGTVEKGSNGEILNTDPATGNTTQQIPKNPQAQSKLEMGLMSLANKFEELHKAGGTVEQGGELLGNLENTIAGSSFTGPAWLGGPEFGGQDVARIGGTKAQQIRDEIHAIAQQQVLPLMQSIGATPGMERAFQAQTALLESLGSKTTTMRQSVLNQLAQISMQQGTGQFADQLGVKPPTSYIGAQPPGQTNTSGRIAIVTPDGKPGTIDPAHLQDLLSQGGQLAQ